jgi:hypothetical protein
MKIACFLQTFNEVETGHLERFIKWNAPLFDYLLVYDDGSTDTTVKALQGYADLLIAAPHNLFKNERTNKKQLLQASKEKFPDIDWFVWLDADEVLYCSREELESIVHDLENGGCDGARLPHINLWRSYAYLRTDEYFDSLAPIRLWKNSVKLAFPVAGGLHGDLNPEGLSTVRKLASPAVVHYGFASDELILRKYRIYQSSGQGGWLLERLISETGRKLEPLASRRNILGSRFEVPSHIPDPPAPENRLTWALSARSNVANDSARPPVITIVCLIYCSVEWLEFVYGEMLRLSSTMRKGDVEILFVANDATPEVIEFLADNGIPHISVKTRKSPDEWFINSVYRAYNIGVQSAQGENVFLINSDMAFDQNCLPELVRHLKPRTFLVSRLVELGVLRTGEHGIERDFGSDPKSFRRKNFESYAAKISVPTVHPGGLFMPLLMNRQEFLDLGGFPEGNLLIEDSSDYQTTGLCRRYALERDQCIPGDRALFDRAKILGYEHCTVFSSIAYHFQAGERRSEGEQQMPINSGVAIINDSIEGINGEKVLWGELHRRLLALNLRSVAIGSEGQLTRLRFHLYARRILRKQRPQPRVVFSNATYSFPFPRSSYRVTLRQDQVSSPWLRFTQSWTMHASNLVLANDPEFTSLKVNQIRQWITVPLSEIWTESAPQPRLLSRGIFVGAFNSTKGWPLVRDFILKHPEIHFVLVSKYEDDELHLPEGVANWTVHRRVDQERLKALYDDAGFFILGSQYETQCLAAVEAASRNLAILMPNTGLLGSLPERLKSQIGSFNPNLDSGWTTLCERWESGLLQPRKTIEELSLIGSESWNEWIDVIRNALDSSFVESGNRPYMRDFLARISSGLRLKIRQASREFLRPMWRKISRSV